MSTRIALLLLGGSLYPAAPVPAATFSVCVQHCDFDTLHEAVAAASDGDVLELRRSEPHHASGLVIDRSITIRAAQDANTRQVVSAAATPGSATDRIVTVAAGHAVTLQDFTLRNGGTFELDGGALHVAAGARVRLIGVDVEDGVARDGGGIYNAGTIELLASSVRGNFSVGAGGGIHNGGDAVLRDSLVENNTQLIHSDGGGGVFNSAAGSLLAQRSSFWSNSAAANGGNLSNAGQAVLQSSSLDEGEATAGGGIHQRSGALILQDTVVGRFVGNHASRGGGLYVEGGSTRIESSSIILNSATHGAGVWACSTASIDLVNSTISVNRAVGDGGGLYACAGASVRLSSVTISNNVADSDAAGGGDGGGIFVASPGQVLLQNTIIDDNEDRTPGTYSNRGPDCFGSLGSHGYNLVGTLGFSLAGAACQLTGDVTGNLVPADAGLGALGDWGGATPMRSLLADSPARDAGDPAGCVDFELTALERDQRGYLRDQACDIGAYEYAGTLPDPLFSSGFESGE